MLPRLSRRGAMVKYHINEDGVSRRCEALHGKCPYTEEGKGLTTEHFDSKEEADRMAQDLLDKKHGSASVVNKDNRGSLNDNDDEINDGYERSYVSDEDEEYFRNPGQYTIAPEDLDEFENRINKANKRLERNGVEDRFTYEKREFKRDLIDPMGVKIGEETLYKVELNRPVIAQDGYVFRASVSEEEGGMLVRTTRESELNGWAPEKLSCDHCGHNRKRKKIYAIETPEGEIMQVGSGCVQDYLGVKPEGLWSLDYDTDNVMPERTGRVKPTITYDVDNTIAVSLAASDFGQDYRKRGGRDTSTAEEVSDFLNPPDKKTKDNEHIFKRNAEIARKLEEMRKDANLMNKVQVTKQEILNMGSNNDYSRNMKTIINSSTVSPKAFGMLCSSAAVLGRKERMQAREAERASREKAKMEKAQIFSSFTSGFAGEVGDSMKGKKATVYEHAPYYYDSYGYNSSREEGSRITMMDSDGHQVTWFSSKKIAGMTAGTQIEFTGGSVKSHKNFRGIDQTMVTRVKLESTAQKELSSEITADLKKSKLQKRNLPPKNNMMPRIVSNVKGESVLKASIAYDVNNDGNVEIYSPTMFEENNPKYAYWDNSDDEPLMTMAPSEAKDFFNKCATAEDFRDCFPSLKDVETYRIPGV